MEKKNDQRLLVPDQTEKKNSTSQPDSSKLNPSTFTPFSLTFNPTIRTVSEKDPPISKYKNPTDFKCFFYPATKSDFPSISRLPNGKLNLDLRHNTATPATEQETTIKLIWPEAKVASHVEHMGETNNKNKVVVKLELPLEMSGDFERIHLWIGRTNSSWITTLEAIFMVLESESALYSPVTAFTTMSPLPNETMTELAQRIRATYYEVPAEDQERRFCKATLIEHIKDFLPQIWSLMRVESSSSSNSSDIVEMLVARTE
ncbi:hypothetical protein EPUL_000829, partial [Erysiphe pulchra]